MAKDDAQKRFQKSFKSYMKSGGDQGGSRIFAGFSALDGPRGGGRGKKPKPEDPPSPPSPPPASPPPPPPPAPAPTQYQNKDWTKVVGHYFPESPGMKAGGLVRGGGAAMKGRGRGRIV